MKRTESPPWCEWECWRRKRRGRPPPAPGASGWSRRTGRPPPPPYTWTNQLTRCDTCHSSPIKKIFYRQCCGSGSRIRCFFDPWSRDPDPGWGENLDPDPGWTYQIIFRELRNSFLGLKILNFFTADPDPGSGIFLTLDSDPGRRNSDSG